jgi:hypothetical protein
MFQRLLATLLLCQRMLAILSNFSKGIGNFMRKKCKIFLRELLILCDEELEGAVLNTCGAVPSLLGFSDRYSWWMILDWALYRNLGYRTEECGFLHVEYWIKLLPISRITYQTFKSLNFRVHVHVDLQIHATQAQIRTWTKTLNLTIKRQYFFNG